MDGAGIGGLGGAGLAGSFPALLSKWVGTTVTIFTSSGGQSGAGFTGVLLSVNEVFVRLISRIGPPPGCALGNACNGFDVGSGGCCGAANNANNMGGFGGGFPGGQMFPGSVNGAEGAGGWNGFPVYTVGSVVDIPVASIVSFVHSAI
ncbi:MAG: hypothetical protein Q8942_04945 [Bacillota bacterium]|nr:hypothetical protein [Bacillota bacterium]